MILTKNLSLIEIAVIESITNKDAHTTNYRFFDERRYTLATKKYDGREYEDAFTHSIYKPYYVVNEERQECIKDARSIITTKKYLTNSEALYILQTLNPTYLPGKARTLKK